MAGPPIFISYRRNDARGWPVHLQHAFEQVFGHGQVFLDTRDIGKGEKYPEVLRQALQDAKVMLVLIGPDWNPECDGHHRLDEADDWVREEVRSGLGHCPLLLPVLLDKGRMPAAGQLPEDLRALCPHQAASIDPQRSIDDVDSLIRCIGRALGLEIRGSGDIGLLALMRLARLQPRAVEAMGAARAWLQHSCEQIDRLVARKLVHDLLHRIESECLNPLVGSRSAEIRLPYIATVDEVLREIGRLREATAMGELIDSLLGDRLPAAALALRTAREQPGRATRQAAVQALRDVLSAHLDRVDQAIADAAREVRLDLLAQELERVLGALPQGERGGDRERIAASIDRLRQAGDELRLRVAEHGLLQRADTELRTLCRRATRSTRGDALVLASGWAPVRHWLAGLDREGSREAQPIREALAAGGCEYLARARARLQALDLRMPPSREPDATLPKELQAAFDDVAREFRAADAALKHCCLQMGQLRGELAVVLASIAA